jgi:hypothetical protein
MYREDIIDAPVGHWLADKNRAGGNVVARLARTFEGGSHLSKRKSARCLDSIIHDLARRFWRKPFRGVIRLLCPRRVGFLDEFDAAPLDHAGLVVVSTEGDESRPSRVSLQP